LKGRIKSAGHSTSSHPIGWPPKRVSIIVPSDSTLVTDLTVLPIAPSDHFPILSYLKLMITPRQPVYIRSIRHVNTIDIDAFIHDLIEYWMNLS